MDFKLIIKKINNTLTKNEEIIFSEWYNESKNHKQYFDNVSANLKNGAKTVDIEKGWLKLNEKLNKKPVQSTYRKYAAVAAVILFMTSSVLWYIKKDTAIMENAIVTTKATIEPGIDTAILTLENGKQVELYKNKGYSKDGVSSNGNSIVYKESRNSTNELTYNYLTIPRGGRFFIQLADSTKVWLNSESKLKYPVNFIKGKARQVELVYGEAYFDVSSSKYHNDSQFIVKTKTQEIVVMGTEFNIRAYEGDYSIFTTLVEGKVKVSNDLLQEALEPGQQSQLNIKTDMIVLNEVDVSREIAWKNGIFLFKAEKLGNIMKKLSRWYNIDVVFEEHAKRDIVFSGKLRRQESIEGLLQNFEDTGDVSFSIENKKIIIK